MPNLKPNNGIILPAFKPANKYPHFVIRTPPALSTNKSGNYFTTISQIRSFLRGFCHHERKGLNDRAADTFEPLKNSLKRYVPRMDVDARLQQSNASAVLRREAKAQKDERLKRKAQESQQKDEATMVELAGILAGAEKEENQ
jgi:hypothetical protein